jgi:hypothetical protein
VEKFVLLAHTEVLIDRHDLLNSLLHMAGPFLIFFTLLIVHTLNPFLASTFCKRSVGT